MKNSPIIKVKTALGVQVNLNANHVISFADINGKLEVTVTGGLTYRLDCTERSFRSYMNKAYGVSKNTEEA